ncbi:MAG: PEP-CTERM sorting domain-containing protein [Schlesneria sp.]
MRSVIKTIFVAFAVAVLAAGTPGALWAGNLVQNGQFTSNTGYGWVGQNFGHGTTSISVSNWNNATNSSFGGPGLNWLFNGNTPTQSVNFDGSAMGLQGSVTRPTGGGNFMALDGDPQYHSKISQSISGLTVGDTYTLTFEFAGAQQTTKSGSGNLTNYLDVTFGSTSQNTETLTRANSSNGSNGVFTGWNSVSMDFVATQAVETLSFLANGTPMNVPPIALLGNISLTDTTPAPSPVPEPSSLCMAAIGCAGLAAVRYRRRLNVRKP